MVPLKRAFSKADAGTDEIVDVDISQVTRPEDLVANRGKFLYYLIMAFEHQIAVKHMETTVARIEPGADPNFSVVYSGSAAVLVPKLLGPAAVALADCASKHKIRFSAFVIRHIIPRAPLFQLRDVTTTDYTAEVRAKTAEEQGGGIYKEWAEEDTMDRLYQLVGAALLWRDTEEKGTTEEPTNPAIMVFAQTKGALAHLARNTDRGTVKKAMGRFWDVAYVKLFDAEEESVSDMGQGLEGPC